VSRNQKDLTRDYPQVVVAAASVKPADVVLDGENRRVGRERPAIVPCATTPLDGWSGPRCTTDLLRCPLQATKITEAIVIKRKVVSERIFMCAGFWKDIDPTIVVS
jgi:hypothetical protein